MSKHVYRIKGLQCSSCAAKIEEKYKQLKGMQHVKMDLMRQILILEGDIASYNMQDYEKIGQKIEDTFKLSKMDNEDKENNQEVKNQIILSMIGLVFLASAALFHYGVIPSFGEYIDLALFIVAYILFGHKVLLSAFKTIKSGAIFDENFLMTIATIGAFALGEYVEAVAVMLFFRIGEMFQDYAVDKSRNQIKSLLNLKPNIAHQQIENSLLDVKPEILKVNDMISVMPGERIPVDGILMQGNGRLDVKSLTGESLPRDVKVGDFILSGSINLSSTLHMRVEKEYQDSTVAKIIAFVENNSTKKAKTEKFITRFAHIYTPIVVISALLLAFIGPLVASIGSAGGSYAMYFNPYVRTSLIFLVISCPCALVLSVPLSYFAGIGRASLAGILVKSGSDLEKLQHYQEIVFDKTGTLTSGEFSVVKNTGQDSQALLEIAAYAESISNHPIAQSIVKAFHGNIEQSRIKDSHEVAGSGVQIQLDEEEVLVGNDVWMKQHHVLVPVFSETGTIVHVAKAKKYLGYLVVKDKVKDEAHQVIQTLQQQKIQVSMVSGDVESVVNDVGQQLGIQEVYAACLPQDKVDIIQRKTKKATTVFVGDGINDAPVLTAASLGIAMGGLGSDIAIEASDIVIMNDHLSKIIEGGQIAQFTHRIVIQNIVFALGIKIIVLSLGLFGFVSMWLALFADVGVSLLAVLNAMRIFKHR